MPSRKRDNRARVLAAMPGTQAEIRERTGLGLATVSRWCEDLRARREAHVGGWWLHPHGGPVSEVWHPGDGVTPRRPRIRTAVQRGRANRQRLRASSDLEDVNARRRARYYARRGTPTPRDPLMRAFYGVAS